MFAYTYRGSSHTRPHALLAHFVVDAHEGHQCDVDVSSSVANQEMEIIREASRDKAHKGTQHTNTRHLDLLATSNEGIAQHPGGEAFKS